MEVDDLLAANQRFAEGFRLGDLPARPARGLAILTCMDARLDPAAALGLAPGDAHVIRNAGGRASADALRSLRVSAWLLGVREIVVIQHTGCGLEGIDEEALRGRIREATGADPGDGFLAFDDPHRNVLGDVARIREDPTLPAGIHVSGLVYDVGSGRLQPVDPGEGG